MRALRIVKYRFFTGDKEVDSARAFLLPVLVKRLERAHRSADLIGKAIVMLADCGFTRRIILSIDRQDFSIFRPALAAKCVRPLGLLWDTELDEATTSTELPTDQGTGGEDASLGNDQFRMLGSEQVGSGQVGSEQVGSGQVGSGQVGFGQVGSGQVGSGQVGSGQVGFGQVGSGQVGSGQVGSGQVGFGQVGSGQVGSGQVGSGQVGSGQVGSGQVGSGQVGFGQVGSGQVGSGQVGFGQVGSGQVGSGQVGSGQVGSGQVGSGQVGSGQVGSGQVGSGQVGSEQVGSGQVGSGPLRFIQQPLGMQVQYSWYLVGGDGHSFLVLRVSAVLTGLHHGKGVGRGMRPK
jgi:PPE-repeat protein